MPTPLCRNLLDTFINLHVSLVTGDGWLAAATSWLSRLSVIRPWPLQSLAKVLASAMTAPLDGSAVFF